jgi:hypothetical protein
VTLREYQRLRDQIEDRYRRDLEALERVWQLAGGGEAPTLSADAPADQSGAARFDHGQVERLVRVTVQKFGDEFTVHQVREYIRRQRPEFAGVPRASISSALRRLAASGRLIVVEQGVGKRPSRYRLSPIPVVENQEEEPSF